MRYSEKYEEPWEIIHRRPRDEAKFIKLSSKIVLQYAKDAAKEFDVKQPETSFEFDIKKAKALLAKKEEDADQVTV